MKMKCIYESQLMGSGYKRTIYSSKHFLVVLLIEVLEIINFGEFIGKALRVL